MVKKVIRDMMKQKVMFFSIFLMAFLGVYLFSGINAMWYSMRVNTDNYYDRTELADLWIWGSSFENSDVEKIGSVEGIGSYEPRSVISSNMMYRKNPKIELVITPENRISKCEATDGREFDPSGEGIWLDYRFAEENDIKVGDIFTFRTALINFEAEVAGLIRDPEYIYALEDSNAMIPEHENYGFAFVPESFMRSLGAEVIYNQVAVTLNSSTSANEASARIEAALGDNYSVIQKRSQHPSFQAVENEIISDRDTSKVFPVLFVLISVFIILSTMIRIVDSQKVQIGIMKALGMKRWLIVLHYLLFGFIPSFFGATAGIIAGPLTLPSMMFESLKPTYTLDTWKVTVSASSVGVFLLVVAACTITAAIPAMRYINSFPCASLRPDANRKIRPSLLERSRIWNKMGFRTRWTYRDIKNAKIRSFMGVVGVISCVMLLVCAFGMRNSIQNIFSWYFDDLIQYDSKIVLTNDADSESKEKIRAHYNGDFLQNATIDLRSAGGEDSLTASITVSDSDLIKYQDTSGDFIELDGVGISNSFAKELGVDVGDTIEWRIFGENGWKKSVIGTIYRTPVYQGIAMSPDEFEAVGYKFEPDSVIAEGTGYTADFDEVSQIRLKSEMRSELEDYIEILYTLSYVMIILAVILAIVVLYILGVLSYVERQREFALLKAQGVESGTLSSLLFNQNIWFMIIGMLIGFPLGKSIIGILFTSGTQYDLITTISLPSSIAALLIAALTSVVVNIIFASKLKKLDMIQILKGID